MLISGPLVGAAQVLIWSYSYVFLPTMSTAIKTDTWQATVYRAATNWTQPKQPCVHRRKTFFLPVAALPQWELSMKVVQLFGLQGPWGHQMCRDMDCLCCRGYGPIRVFFRASCSWRSEGFFGQSFSVARSVQALRGLPCLGSFSVVWCIRHMEGPPWLESYSVDQGVGT